MHNANVTGLNTKFSTTMEIKTPVCRGNALKALKAHQVPFDTYRVEHAAGVFEIAFEQIHMKSCICEAGDPCDYHAASCITCVGKCAGHPDEQGT